MMAADVATVRATRSLASMSQSPIPLYHVSILSDGQRTALTKLKMLVSKIQAQRQAAATLRCRICHTSGEASRNMTMAERVPSMTACGYTGKVVAELLAMVWVGQGCEE